MTGLGLLAALTLCLIVAGVIELGLHRRRVRAIPIRIHVNGTRGKSSVTRLIAAGLRAGGLRTCAKTTGTRARLILPDGSEAALPRSPYPNVIEQKRVVALAAAAGTDALVIECMALQPELQALSGLDLVAATHGVITNTRPDHLEQMGPTEADVARALAGSVPCSGRLFATATRHRAIFDAAARDRGCEATWVEPDEVRAVTEDELCRFAYTEHRENVALALRVCEALGMTREAALAGMWDVEPDPGALRSFVAGRSGREVVFYNAFAANDPVSTGRLWRYALARHPDAGVRVALFNCRADRPERSLQLARAMASWPAADHVVLMGSGVAPFARSALRAGLTRGKLVSLEQRAAGEVFERLLALAAGGLVVGMGNIGGQGLPLVRRFARARAGA